MHENQGNAITFYSHYTEGGVAKTGLTVTIDVYEVIRDGTATLVTNDGACTEIGAGLYRYILASGSVDAAAEYVGVFHTATDTVDCQDIPAIWVIDRAGLNSIPAILEDTGTTLPATLTTIDNFVDDIESTLTAIKGVGWSDETLVAIKAALDTIDVSGVASAVWSAATRTLTQSAASVASAVAGSTITATRGDTLSAALTNIGALTNYDKIWFTVKADEADTDAQSLIQIELTDGLKYINGAAAVTSANGSITIDDEATGDVTVALDEVETAKLAPKQYHYDIQILRSTGIAVSTLSSGTFIVSADYTKATS